MNEANIDAVARGLAIAGPRRRLLGGLSGAVLTLLGAGTVDETALAGRRRRRGSAPGPWSSVANAASG
ncbi:MAG: hypothetical protein M3464_11075 [Chloroflexota bacterium]|nr:hypothetical protein [Chloroflexota bacterium]